jgi:hypothetical protein
MDQVWCGDNSCICVDIKSGMATNGGCRCDERALRQAVHYWKNKTPDSRLRTIINYQNDIISRLSLGKQTKSNREFIILLQDQILLLMKAIAKDAPGYLEGLKE